jgi:hypothetical protein
MTLKVPRAETIALTGIDAQLRKRIHQRSHPPNETKKKPGLLRALPYQPLA